MVATKSIFVALLCAVAQLSSAVTLPVDRETGDLRTNAARLAAGLNPLTPRGLERRTGGGYYYTPPRPPTPPTPPPPGPSPRPPTPPPPPKPPVKRDGKLKCKRNGVHIGWVGRDFSNKDRNKKGFGLCSMRDSALSVNFDDDDEKTPLNIRLPNHGDFPFLGWVGNNLNSDNSCILTKTQQTNNNGPQNVGNAFTSWAANSESSNWFFGKGSKNFSFNWVNSGGAKPATKTFYNPDDDCFHLVSDVGRFQRRCPKAFEVELEFD